jgi:2-keto-3-deoxy-L-rhamnonate aldolase RhmA
MLKEGRPVVGIFMVSGSRAALEVLAVSGFDFVLFDTQHFMLNNETIEQLITAAEAAGVTPFIRVQENHNLNLIDRSLSAGARGVMIPFCDTKEIAQEAVNAAKYAPIGKRGACNPRAVTYGAKGIDDMVSFYKEENENLMVIAQIETARAVDNLPEILTVQGIDCFFIGPHDLSHSLGLTGKYDDPTVQAYINKAFELVKNAKRPISILSGNAEQSNAYFQKGYDMVSMSCDMRFLARAVMEEMTKIKR